MISKTIVSIFLVAVVQFSNARSPVQPTNLESADCPTFCPALFQPVCGSDGATYDNECQLELTSCTGSPIYKLFDGECSKEFGTPKCLEKCNGTYEPVCASDGNTYYNECELNRTLCQGSSIHKVSKGACESSPKQECPEICSFAYQPVCGSDGVTYTNECELSRVSCNDSSVFKKAESACELETPDCFYSCNDIYLPVCGSDGNTYANDCELEYVKCKNSAIVKVSEGQCDGRDIFSPVTEEAVTSDPSEFFITTTES